MNQEERAFTLADRFHAGQEYSGRPYIDGHLLPIAARAGTAAVNGVADHVRAVAMLHDVLEDTTCTVEALRAGGIEERSVIDVVCLTRVDELESYQRYVDRVCAEGSYVARLVKKADLEWNIICSENTEYEHLARKRWPPALVKILRSLG